MDDSPKINLINLSSLEFCGKLNKETNFVFILFILISFPFFLAKIDLHKLKYKYNINRSFYNYLNF